MKKSEERLELDKILAAAAGYATLEEGRAAILACAPVSDLSAAKRLIDTTEEATLLLFELGAGGIEEFPPLGDMLERAEKGATLTCDRRGRCISRFTRMQTGASCVFGN